MKPRFPSLVHFKYMHVLKLTSKCRRQLWIKLHCRVLITIVTPLQLNSGYLLDKLCNILSRYHPLQLCFHSCLTKYFAVGRQMDPTKLQVDILLFQNQNTFIIQEEIVCNYSLHSTHLQKMKE